MKEHTPGPWRTGDRFNTVFGPPQPNATPDIIATVHKGNEANARLLARAPELLAENQRLQALGESALRAASGEIDELRIALRESVKLQSFYAEQLNVYDGGKRMPFRDSDEWIARLKTTGTLA